MQRKDELDWTLANMSNARIRSNEHFEDRRKVRRQEERAREERKQRVKNAGGIVLGMVAGAVLASTLIVYGISYGKAVVEFPNQYPKPDKTTMTKEYGEERYYLIDDKYVAEDEIKGQMAGNYFKEYLGNIGINLENNVDQDKER